jgi:lysophospholipase L1-like esterase
MKDLSLPKKVAFSAIAVIGALGLLEGMARLALSAPTAPTFEEHGRLIRVLGLPALNDILEFDPVLFWRLKPELRGFRVEGRIRDHPMDFRVTTHRSLRSPEVGARTRFRVLALGDSCTFGIGVEDGETWPAHLERRLRESGVDAEVVNAGVPGYTAFQGKRFLETRGLELAPDLVIVTFGFNDADDGMPQSDLETARALAQRDWTSVLSKSRLAQSVSGLAQRPPPVRPKRPRLTVPEYLETLGAIKGMCDARGIGMIVAIWPYEAQVRERAPDYVLLQISSARFCQERGVGGVDLINAFLRADGPLFLDHIHASPLGCRVAAESLLPWVVERASRRSGI